MEKPTGKTSRSLTHLLATATPLLLLASPCGASKDVSGEVRQEAFLRRLFGEPGCFQRTKKSLLFANPKLAIKFMHQPPQRHGTTVSSSNGLGVQQRWPGRGRFAAGSEWAQSVVVASCSTSAAVKT